MILGQPVIIRPTANRQVPINDGQGENISYLPTGGKKCILDKYWVRRKLAGEVTITEVSKTKAKKRR